ncbi:MAG: hypothetical protein R2709_13395 [Marmoricola sp.]
MRPAAKKTLITTKIKTPAAFETTAPKKIADKAPMVAKKPTVKGDSSANAPVAGMIVVGG